MWLGSISFASKAEKLFFVTLEANSETSANCTLILELSIVAGVESLETR